MIRHYLTRYAPYESTPGYDKNKDPNYCITTIDNLVLTTRTEPGIYTELQGLEVTKFGDAASNVEYHKNYSINDRINEITSVFSWVDSIKNKEQENV